MKIVINICVGVAVVSLLLSIIARVTLSPIPLFNGVTARALLNFTNSALLFAIALILLKTKNV